MELGQVIQRIHRFSLIKQLIVHCLIRSITTGINLCNNHIFLYRLPLPYEYFYVPRVKAAEIPLVFDDDCISISTDYSGDDHYSFQAGNNIPVFRYPYIEPE